MTKFRTLHCLFKLYISLSLPNLNIFETLWLTLLTRILVMGRIVEQLITLTETDIYFNALTIRPRSSSILFVCWHCCNFYQYYVYLPVHPRHARQVLKISRFIHFPGHKCPFLPMLASQEEYTMSNKLYFGFCINMLIPNASFP